MVTDAIETMADFVSMGGGAECKTSAGSACLQVLDIHRFWSLKNKFPASSRRLATLPMMAQTRNQVTARGGDGVNAKSIGHR